MRFTWISILAIREKTYTNFQFSFISGNLFELCNKRLYANAVKLGSEEFEMTYIA